MAGIRYFPLTSNQFEHLFGVRALRPDESIVQRTESFEAEIAEKSALLQKHKDNYCQSMPGSEASEQEASELLIGRTCLLIETALEIQEDIVLLSGAIDSGNPIIAGVVCFPSGWSIADKVGLGIDAIHAPVPEYAQVMSHATNQLLSRLKPGRPVWRTNWGIRPSDRLDQSPKQLASIHKIAQHLTAENIGHRCCFRVERQTLSRLPRTLSILFTIHTYQCSLDELEPWQRSNLLGVLRTCPPATLSYKGLDPIFDSVCGYLASRE